MQQAIVDCARGYIGTPFHHQGRRKGVGIDCLGLLVEVARELALVSRTGELLADCDELNYSHQPDTQKMIRILSEQLYPIPVAGIDAGDIILLNIDRSPQHMGIVSDIGLIHAYAQARKVVEHRLDADWQSRIHRAYQVCPKG